MSCREASIRRRAVRSAVIAVLGAGVPAIVPAQEGRDAAMVHELDEIVVTARKRAERAQETPVAMAVVTADEIRERNLLALTDVGSFTPNVSLSAGSADVGGAANAVFFIRGIGQSDYAPTADPGLGLYVDGVYLGRSQGAVLELTDIERIEILKGPQGTLFGKNTMGGALNITTRRPVDRFEGSVGVMFGEDDRVNVDADLNLPLADSTAARFALSHRSQDGFQRRVLVGDRVGEEGTTVARAKLQFLPTPQTNVLLSADYTRIDADANTAYNPVNDPRGLVSIWNLLVGIPSGNPVDPATSSADPRATYGTGSFHLDFEGGGASVHVEHQFERAMLRSITAYRQFDSRNQRDNDGGPGDFGQLDYRDEQWQLSQEFNLVGSSFDGRLDYTLGVYYFGEESESRWYSYLARGTFEALEGLPGPLFPLDPAVSCPPPPGIPAPCAGGAGNPLNVVLDVALLIAPNVETQSYAAFFEGEWHFTDALSAFAGIRYTRDEKDYTFWSLRLGSGTYQVPETIVRKTWDDISPRIGLKYQPAENVMLYATVAQGFKSGGFNARPGSVTVAQRPYDPEELWSYEVGFKSELGGRRVRLNGAAFFYDYEDMQLYANGVVPDSPSPVQFIDNIGEARLWGAELDLIARLTSRFSVSGSVGYLNAKYREAATNITGVTTSTKLPKAPEWSATAAAEYVVPFSAGSLALRADYSYVGTNYPDARNTPALKQEAHSLVNARIGWTSRDEHWTVSAYARNLFDEKFVANGFDVWEFTGTVIAIPSEPREVGLHVIRRF